MARGKLENARVLSLLWRPLVALAGMLAALFALGQSLLALILSGGVYVAILLLLRPLDAAEGAALLRLLPEGGAGVCG